MPKRPENDADKENKGFLETQPHSLVGSTVLEEQPFPGISTYTYVVPKSFLAPNIRPKNKIK
jgi:hypothetical protein